MLARQPASNAPPPAEDVHQMRIATRRLRIALRLFRRMLPNEAKQFRKDFGSFARALGDVRDLDVYSREFPRLRASCLPENIGELGGYELHLRRERTEARNNLSTLFADERHAALLRSFAALLEDAPSPAAVRRWRSFKVADGVDKYLKKSLKRVLKLGNKSARTRAPRSCTSCASARSASATSSSSSSPSTSLAKAAKATKALQDLLGVHQDACTATESPPGACAQPAQARCEREGSGTWHCSSRRAKERASPRSARFALEVHRAHGARRVTFRHAAPVARG